MPATRIIPFPAPTVPRFRLQWPPAWGEDRPPLVWFKPLERALNAAHGNTPGQPEPQATPWVQILERALLEGMPPDVRVFPEGFAQPYAPEGLPLLAHLWGMPDAAMGERSTALLLEAGLLPTPELLAAALEFQQFALAEQWVAQGVLADPPTGPHAVLDRLIQHSALPQAHALWATLVARGEQAWLAPPHAQGWSALARAYATVRRSLDAQTTSAALEAAHIAWLDHWILALQAQGHTLTQPMAFADDVEVPSEEDGDDWYRLASPAVPALVHAHHGLIGLVYGYLRHGASVQVADAEGTTLLMVAAQRHHASLVEAVLEAGADPHATSAMGSTALHHWAYHTFLDDGQSRPHWPFRRADVQATLVQLLAAGIDPNAVDDSEDTALHVLIQRKARCEDWQGFGAQEGLIECVRLLLNAGADARRANGFEQTALALAEEDWPEAFDVMQAFATAQTLHDTLSDGLDAPTPPRRRSRL